MIEKIKSLYRYLSPKYQSIHLEYKVSPKPRYGHGHPAHAHLLAEIEKNRQSYEMLLENFLDHIHTIHAIQDYKTEISADFPTWNNGYLPGLDIITLYGIIAKYKPTNYIEIGSGNSTKVARKAINENQLKTQITSIDPFPRANINHLADNVIRKPFEDLNDYRFIVDELQDGDIIFIDNSHRVFSNSDVMVCFLEILPMLKKGVLVQIHDVYLPYDYPQFMCDRFYNEQYLLAAFILANPARYKTILPNYFISQDKDLAKIISPIWEHPNLINLEKHGGSFWLQIN